MELNYRGKHILAPMVRVGTLPFRLLAAQYGADIMYGEELIDHKVIRCTRQVNDLLGTIDFVEKGTGEVIFRTCELERRCIVFQILTSNATRALNASQRVCQDVATIDLNRGYPKSFALSRRMGETLLTRPEIIHDILTTLKRNLRIPVTCKICLQETIEVVRRIEKTGVSAIAVHGRKVADKLRHLAQWGAIADVLSMLSIPVIANGGIFKYSDFRRIKDATVHSVG
eukprot:c25424_g1_i4 orf=81-764(-)